MAPRSFSPTARCSSITKPVSRLQLQHQNCKNLGPVSKPQPPGQHSEDSRGAFIRVVARVRPKLPHEIHAASGMQVDVGSSSITLTNSSGKGKKFCIDNVFDSRQEQGSQDRVFCSFVMNYVTHSLSGFNVCLFAYGHTGSGKTYTMLGDENCDASGSQAGMIPRFLNELFSAHASDADQHVRRYSCEFYEIYNEQIKDLLVPAKSDERARKVHVQPNHGVWIENLTATAVSSAAETLQLVEFGSRKRTVAATALNAQSSRSHAVFTFRYEQDTCDAQSRRSMVTFVDLAGREDLGAKHSGATHKREVCCINTSLFHLATVITKLSQGSIDGRSLADFRNSKLTLLLSPALMGNSKTALIATVAPLQELFDDSLSTMNFAASVKKIKTNPVINNKKASTSVVSELEAELRQLQSELNIAKTREAEKERALLNAQALVNMYKTSWEDAVQESKQSEITHTKSLKDLQLQSQDSSDSWSTSSSADSSSTRVSSPSDSATSFDTGLQSPGSDMSAPSEDITCWLSKCLHLQHNVISKSSGRSLQQGSAGIIPTDCTDLYDAAKHSLQQLHLEAQYPSPSNRESSSSCSSRARKETLQEVAHELQSKTPRFGLGTEEFHNELDDLEDFSLEVESGSSIHSPSRHSSCCEGPFACHKPSAPSAGRTSEDPAAFQAPGTATVRADVCLEHAWQSDDLAKPMSIAAIGNASQYGSSCSSSVSAHSCPSSVTASPKRLTPTWRRHSPMPRWPSPAPCQAAVVTKKHSGGLSQSCEKDFSATRCSPPRSSASPSRRFVGPFPKLTWAYYEVPENL